MEEVEVSSQMADVAAVLSSILSSVIWSLVGVALLLMAVKIFDWADPIPYHDEIRKGNVAAGVVLGAVVLGMSIIIFAAVR